MLEQNLNYDRGQYVADAIKEGVKRGFSNGEACDMFTALESKVIAYARMKETEPISMVGNNELLKKAYWLHIADLKNLDEERRQYNLNEFLYRRDER